jgi:type IV secretion system protein VirD4
MQNQANPQQRQDTLETLVAVAVVAFVLAGAVAWAAGELGGRILHGRWIPVAIEAAPGVLFGLVSKPGDPASAWPAASRSLVPPAPLYYGILAVLAVLAMAAVWICLLAWLGFRRPATPAGRHRGWSTPRRLRLTKRLGMRAFEASPNLFLGFATRSWPHRLRPWGRPCFTPTIEEPVALVGPTRSGKSLGNIVPAVALFLGSDVVTSTKPDVYRWTAGRREEMARDHGGRVLVLDWTGRATRSLGVPTIRWSPLDGCASTEVCSLRVENLLDAADNKDKNAAFWDTGAAKVLRPYLHAGALGGQSIRDVMRWMDAREFAEPAKIIERAESLGTDWARSLLALQGLPHQTLDGYFETARACLRALEEPVVMANATDTNFDIDEFLETYSTLYVVDAGGEGKTSATAPLIASLIEWIVYKAYRRADLEADGRCNPGLHLALDEVANIAPLPSLPNLLSQGPGRGIVVTWASQSFAQMRHRYGADQARAILSNSTNRIIFGGLADRQDLEDISALAGDYEDWQPSHGEGAYGESTNWHLTKKRVVPVERLARIPRGRAVLIHAGNPTWLAVPPAPTVPGLATVLGAPTPTTSTQVRPESLAAMEA